MYDGVVSAILTNVDMRVKTFVLSSQTTLRLKRLFNQFCLVCIPAPQGRYILRLVPVVVRSCQWKDHRNVSS